MVHGIHKFVRASGRRLLTFAMLPAFFIASLPHWACICADGHRTSACPMLRTPTAAFSVAKQSSGKSCCQKRIAQEARACCASGTRLSGGHGTTAIKTASSCCRVVVELPAAATSVKQADAKNLAASAIAEPFVQLFGIGVSQAAFAISFQSPPPIDAVILYSRLTI